MKRNMFFVRFYLSSLAEETQGLGLVSEQYFTTKQEYVFKYPVGTSITVSQQLTTGLGVYQPGVVDSSNGCILAARDALWLGSPPGVLYVDFKVDEKPGEMFKITNPEVKFNTGSNRFINLDWPTGGFKLSITAYAIGIVDDIGQINGAVGNDNVRWIKDASFKDPNRSLIPKQFMTGKWVAGSAFNKPTFLPLNGPMEDIIFEKVYTELIPTETECCENQANSLALVAAASLIASNNITSPLLIKKIENAVSKGFSAASTISALQSMRQLGTVSNVTGKMLDNAIPKSNEVVIIKNGPQ